MEEIIRIAISSVAIPVFLCTSIRLFYLIIKYNYYTGGFITQKQFEFFLVALSISGLFSIYSEPLANFIGQHFIDGFHYKTIWVEREYNNGYEVVPVFPSTVLGSLVKNLSGYFIVMGIVDAFALVSFANNEDGKGSGLNKNILPATTIVALAVGMFDMPHSYYNVLRAVVFFAFLSLARESVLRKEPLWPLVFFIIAIVFEPIVQFAFQKHVWQIIDIFVITIMVIVMVSNYRKSHNPIGIKLSNKP